MTAVAAVSVRHRTPRAASAVPLNAARLLRVELRRNTMPWILPLIAALFWFDSYRPSTGTPPLYELRTYWNMGQGHTILDFGPFVAGVAAWMGSRDGRRGLADLVTTTVRPRWAAQLATWAATAIWAVAAYLVFVGVMFAVYAHQGVGGTPPWWWVAVGGMAVIAFSAAGFAIGAYWPSRFAAPVAAFGGFLAMFLSFQTGFSHTSGWALILPTNSSGTFDSSAQTDSGIFYPWLPDLPIARIMFLAGIAVAALGLTGLPARAGGPWLRRAAARVTLAGLALARLARRSPDRAADRPAHPQGPAMTTVGLHRPTPGSVPPPAAGTRRDRAAAGWRLARLYLVSRRVPMALVLLAGLGALLWAALHWRWNIAGGAAARQFIPLTIQTGAAAVIAVTTYGPFGEPERAAGRWLPWLRLGAAVALTAVAFGALAAGAAAGGMPGGSFALLRNFGGMAGIGLLSAVVLGGAFGWTGPMAYLLITEGALAHRSATPWVWPTRPPHDRGGAICACLVLAAGLVLITVRGPRESSREPDPAS